ncbi:MAG: cbb3-type cytochrome c oxidase subunit I [Planctomycetota bacterium]
MVAGIPEANRAEVHGDNYLTHTRGFLSWALTLDHKRIAIMYMIGILGSFLLGGIFALLLRLELIGPGALFNSNENAAWDFYNHMFTIHGAVMTFLFIIPGIPAIIGNFALPIMLGAKDVAFPRLNLASFYVWLAGGVFFVYVLLSGVLEVAFGWHLPGGFGLDTGWTFYTPYSTTKSESGVIPATLGAFVLGFASILTAVNFLASIHMLRPKGMTWFRMPLLLWSLYSTAIIQILATPVLAITLLLLVAERSMGIGIFDPLNGGDPVLYQHFFWFYSHPAVYIMILPALGVISEIIGIFCRKHIFGYNFIALSSLAIALFSFIVWGHHMFTSGQSALASALFSLLTFSVSIPSAVKVFNWLGTMYKGSIRMKAPMWYVVGAIWVFTIGGLTGLFLATLRTDIHLHDTYFVVAHFHYVMMGTVLFALVAGIYYWFPKMFGKMYDEKWAGIWAVVTLVGFNVLFFPLFIAGSQGMPRRYASYEDQYIAYHVIATVGSWILAVGLFGVLHNWIQGLRKGKKAPPNPWGANTLEWQTSSPPPHDNFKVTPAAGDPYAIYRWQHARSTDPEVADGWQLKPEYAEALKAAGPGHRVVAADVDDYNDGGTTGTSLLDAPDNDDDDRR